MTKPEKIFDGLLVLQYRNGNEKALSLLVNRWHTKLCKHAYWYIKDTEVAKDVAQESWRVILGKIDRLNDVNSFGSWALIIVHRKALDYLRSQQRTERKLRRFHQEIKRDDTVAKINNTSDNSYQFTAAITPNNVMKSINDLPNNQQIVLRLFYVEAYSILEISNILEISKGTVKSRLFYAREKLKSIFKNKNHEE